MDEMQYSDRNDSVGVLQLQTSITLHSIYASRLWQGRSLLSDEEGKRGFFSVPSALSKLRDISWASANDDPFADMFLYNFEQETNVYAQFLKEKLNEIVELINNGLPDGVDFHGCTTEKPLSYPLRGQQIGMKFCYLLKEFDSISLGLFSAYKLALLPHDKMVKQLNDCAVPVRRLLTSIRNYQDFGITRADVRDNNAKYRILVEKFNMEIPEEILNCTLRATFAPRIINKSSNVTITQNGKTQTTVITANRSTLETKESTEEEAKVPETETVATLSDSETEKQPATEIEEKVQLSNE